MLKNGRDILIKILTKFHLVILLIFSAILNIWRPWGLGYGNEYYAAAIKSMLTSFSNFFFLSLDSTGYISVDKPPLSLWVDAIFAKVFGFSGFSILLPHAIEGILVTLLVYLIVKKVAGKLPGFIAGLVITFSPVNVAVYRNNTPDALLLVFLLLAVYFLMKYFDKKQLKYVILSAVMVGLGFNTKMLQAFLILPALIGSLLIFSQGNIWQRIKPILLFLVVTAIVSFSWITIVDLTPASSRPYVGSSTSNSAWDLAFNYNGTQRLTGEDSVGNSSGFNVGEASLLRLFTGEMGTQTGWFLVTALGYAIFFLIKNFKVLWLNFVGKTNNLSGFEKLMLINVIFMLTGFAFFSYAGFFHSYYLNIFAVPLAFLTGGLFFELYRSGFKNIVLWIILAASLPMQIYLILMAGYGQVLIPVIILLALLACLLVLIFKTDRAKFIACLLVFFALFLTPLVWSAYTTLEGNTATAIFIGGPSVQSSGTMAPGNRNDGGNAGLTPNGRSLDGTNAGFPGNFNTTSSRVINGNGGGNFNGVSLSTSLVSYLAEHYNGEKYYVAVTDASVAEGFILDENIGNVMTLGGFSGRDESITLSALKEKIAAGEIKFFYFGSSNGNKFNANSEIETYVTSSCTSISSVSGLYHCSE